MQSHIPPQAWEHFLLHEVSEEPTQTWPWLLLLSPVLETVVHITVEGLITKCRGRRNLVTGSQTCNRQNWIQMHAEPEVSLAVLTCALEVTAALF